MTKTAKHSLLFRLWIHIRGILALAIVLFGVVVGLVSLILPNESLYKHHVVDFLAKKLQKQVQIEKISGKWQGFGPNFIISGLVIDANKPDEVMVQQMTLDVNFIKYLIPKGSTGIRLGVDKIDIDFVKKATGEIILTEDKIEKDSFTADIEKVLSMGSLLVRNLNFNIKDQVKNIKTEINSHILVQQDDNKRAFNLELHSKQLADKFNVKAITNESYDFFEKAKWYLDIEKLSLEYLSKFIHQEYLPQGLMNAQVWLNTDQGNIIDLMAKITLSNEQNDSESNQSPLNIESELVYSGNKKNWQAELSINAIELGSIIEQQLHIKINRKNNLVIFKSKDINLSLIQSALKKYNMAEVEFELLNTSGVLTDVALTYDLDLRRIVDVDMEFEQLKISTKTALFTGLAGNASLSNEQIRLRIDSENGTARFPSIIRGQVEWNSLQLTAQTSMYDEDLDIKVNSLWCDCRDFILDGAARTIQNDELFLDLSFAVYQANVNQLYKYWPSIKWKPNVLNFLDQALQKGQVDRGMIIYHGKPIDYPFIAKQGVFSTHSELNNANINYHKDWPVLENFKAVVNTMNQSLTVDSTKGDVMDAVITKVDAIIPSFKEPFLNIDINATGQNNYLIDFLNQSPMKEGLNVLQQEMSFKGKQDIFVSLDMPLNDANVKITPEGYISYNATDFQIGQFQLNELNGQIDFSGFSLDLKNVTSKFLNQNVSVNGEIINEPNKDALIDIQLKGDYAVENFESQLGVKLPASGGSPWSFSVSNVATGKVNFTAESDLIGVQLDMPEPFAKEQEKLAPFSISCELPCLDTGWDVNFDNKLHSSFVLDQSTKDITMDKLVFGNEAEKTTDFDFGGELDVVDVDKWIEIFANNNSDKKGEYPFEEMSLHMNKLIFMNRPLLDVQVNIKLVKGDLLIDVNAEDISGRITIPKDIENKGIIVQLDKLHWNETADLEVDSNTKISSSYPALHVWIGDFIYDGIPLGSSIIEVRPVAQGLMVEKFNTQSELMDLNINGIWTRDEGEKGRSEFNIIMTSKNIADFLTKIGFQAPISQAQTIVDLKANWPGFPSQFEIKNISGEMRIEIGEGEVVDAEPGMGRILGLFSLTNLPRRLILDFKDVVGKGLQFQSMQGDFSLVNGEAYTENFEIDSSSAKILITGITGLANQNYDQTVVVTPRVGRVLPTIGAIAGGAVGAAAGFLVQGMFSKGLKKIGKIIYKVTGTWDEPIIILVETEENNNKSETNEK